jgi:aminopeptidase N
MVLVRRFIVALLFGVTAGSGGTGSGQGRQVAGDPERGVSDGLARDRASRVSALQYDLAIDIPAEPEADVTGRVTISFSLSDASAPLALDFAPDRPAAVHTVEAGNRRVEARPVNGHIVLPAGRLRAGDNTVAIEFVAGRGPLNRHDDFLYTIFVPSRAHEAFPCFDQPDLKARWTVSLTVPDGWETLANGTAVSVASRDGRTRTTFSETAPLPTYLVAFAAGRFSVEREERDGRVMRMFHRETDGPKVERNRTAIFDLHRAALDWLERYTGVAYPFGKFDFALIPAFQFGGMEHPGAIFYNADALLLDQSATENQMLERARAIAHETAHMWFGNLVTMRWFTDVWMKEVFANFMAARIVEPSFPGVNHDLRFLFAHYPAAYDVDRTAGTHPIRQELANLREAGTLYGAIIYQKAPIVMRQLEAILGEAVLQDGLRQYLRRHAFANASWPDLIALLDRRTPQNLGAWSHAWVEEAGRPIITTDLGVQDGRIARLSLQQSDPDPRRGLTWDQQLQVALGYADRVELVPIRLTGPAMDVRAAVGRPAPLFVLPNGGGVGYGQFRLDPASLAALRASLPQVSDSLTRGSAWVTLWDAMLSAEADAAALIELALRALPRETDEQNVQRVLGYLAAAYWRFVPDAQRSALAPRIERTLRDGLDAAGTTSLKGAYFSTLRDVALTRSTLEWLESVWNGRLTVRGLVLSEADHIRLAQELAVRAVPGWMQILDQQEARTMNPDRRSRLQFVRPALSSDPADRDRFFASLGQVSNRRHEPWALEGLRYLHHPLRSADAERYIRPGLELLQDVQRTGDVFFPKRWTDATLGGHRSKAAAQTVREFLAALPPGYPARLRRIVLASADDLFRASQTSP